MNRKALENFRQMIAEAPFDDEDGEIDLPEEWDEPEVDGEVGVDASAALPVGHANLGVYAAIGVRWTRPALKGLNRAPADLQEAIDKCVRRLQETGDGPYKKLHGRQKDGATGRLRVGTTRIRVRTGSFGIDILNVDHRKDVYR